MDTARIFHGACHCHATKMHLTWPMGQPVPARRCGCDFCTRHGAIWAAHPDATLYIDGEELEEYLFGTETAHFLFCRHCGVLVAAVWKDGEELRSVVEVRAFSQLDHEEPTAADFSGETRDERLARRARTWIGCTILKE